MSAPIYNVVATRTIDDNDFPFTLQHVLGTGAHSKVYYGVDKTDASRAVAVKVIQKGKLNKTLQLRLKREVDIHRACRHPNIVQLLDVFESTGTIYLVMELMTGGELFDRILKKRSFPESEASALMKSIVSTVTYLHQNGIAHRDLKPENLLYATTADDAIVKIADFGLAKLVNDDGSLKTPCGTPGYIAPEIAKMQVYKQSVDMWSLGVILYTLLCGFPPFYDADTRVLLEQVKKGSFRFPSPFWDGVSDSAKELVSALLNIDASKRFTAEQTLAHPWIQGTTAVLEDLQSPTGMREFSARSAREGPDAFNRALAIAIEAQRAADGDADMVVTNNLPGNSALWKRRAGKKGGTESPETAISVPVDGHDSPVVPDLATAPASIPDAPMDSAENEFHAA